jgi:hypothetical protein
MKTWIADFGECMQGAWDKANVIISADSFEDADVIAKQWEQYLKIKLIDVKEFTTSAELIFASYG